MPRLPGIAYWVDAPGRPYRPLVTQVQPNILEAPTAVEGIRLADDRAELRWAPPAKTGGLTITGYKVSRDGLDQSGYGAWGTVVGPEIRSFVFMSLRPDTYSLSVSAMTSTIESPRVSVSVYAGTIVAPVLTVAYEA